MNEEPRYLKANAHIQIPTPELYTRLYNTRVTAYAYEEVINTLENMDALYTELDALIKEADRLLAPYTWMMINQAPDPLRALYALMNRTDVPIFSPGNVKQGGRQECYPVSTWKVQMGTYRRAIKSLKKALAACQSKGPERISLNE